MSLNFIEDEIKAVLNILYKSKQDKKIEELDWEQMFSSDGFKLLRQREEEMGNQLKQETFRDFLLNEIEPEGYDKFQNAYQNLKEINFDKIISKTKRYLPNDVVINTDIIPVIKPTSNSFVHNIDNKLVLFLYLKPNISKQELINKLIHELHHIGLDDVYQKSDYTHLSKPAQRMIEWTNAFGEGFAMLAAAGGPDAHPNRFDEQLKARWNENISNLNRDFKEIEKFLLNILNKNFSNQEELYNKGFQLMTKNGGQGPWYTVGHKLAVVIEKMTDKKVLTDCMKDFTQLYLTYNKLVVQYNKKYNENLPQFSEEIIGGLKKAAR